MSDLNNKRFVTYVPHEDNVQESISAKHINELQEGIEDAQVDSFQHRKKIFLTKALFSLENHSTSNSMIIDTLEDDNNFDFGRSNNVYYRESTQSIVFDEPEETEGEAYSKIFVNPNGNPYRKLVLVVHDYVEEGATIDYEVSYDNVTFHPITPHKAQSFDLPDEATHELTIRMLFKKDNEDAIARVDSWGILYYDMEYGFIFLDDGLSVELETTWDGTIIP